MLRSIAAKRLCSGTLSLWVILVGVRSAAFSQVAVDVWTTDDGLPQNITRSICQTPDGYIWIATFDGLVRFDGVRFTVFDRSNTPGIKGNRFGTMFCTKTGDFWAGTEGSGLTRYHNGRFTTYTDRDGLLSDTVEAVSDDGRGHLWALSRGYVNEWHESEKRFVALVGEEYRYSYYTNPNGSFGFWRIDEKAVHHFNGGPPTIHKLPLGWPHNVTTTAGQDFKGNLWLWASTGDLVVLIRDQWSWILRRGAPNGSRTSLISEYRDSLGATWQTETVWVQGSGPVTYMDLPPGSNPNRVAFTSLFEDREANLWLCTNGQGLYRLRTQAIKVLSREEGLPDRIVYPVYQSRDGSIWIGTWSSGLARYRNGNFKTYLASDRREAHWINAIFEDRSGTMWVSSDTATLYRAANGRFEPVVWKGSLGNGESTIRVIHQDPGGTMWFGTEDGLVRFDGNQWRALTREDGLPTDDIRAIITRRDGTLWVAGYGGMASLDNGRIRSWTEKDGLASNTIRTLYEDADAVLWIGTYDGGLSRFQNGRFTSYTVREGLANNGVFQILEDSRGNLWMSSNRGIHRANRNELNRFAAGGTSRIFSVSYGKRDGMRNAECNGGLMPAGIKAQDGTLWFPTQDGVAVVEPEKLLRSPTPPPVIIESYAIDGLPGTLHPSAALKPDSENLEIHYTAPSLVNSERIRFRYQLVGLDTDWVDADTRRTAYYSHLPPGNYTFQVTAAHSDGAWNTDAARLSFVVLPRFYRTWWFTLSLWIAGVSVLWMAFRYRYRQLERARAAQQSFSRRLITSQENERKRVAAEIHDSLGQRLVIIKNLAIQFLKNSKDSQRERGKVDEISEECSLAIEEVREISYNLRPYQLDRLGLRKAVLALVRTAAKATSAKLDADVDDIDLFFPREAEINFYRIVQECLTNVVKHSEATEVHLDVRRDDDNLSLAVRDNGKGFAAGVPNGDPTKGGFGLQGIRERAQLLGGQAVIHTSPGRGTTISIHFSAKGLRNGT